MGGTHEYIWAHIPHYVAKSAIDVPALTSAESKFNFYKFQESFFERVEVAKYKN